MSVVIQPEDSTGQADELKALLADIRAVAKDEPVTLVSGGVRVSRKVALAYLRGKSRDADTSGYTVDNTREPLTTIHTDASTGADDHPDDSHARPDNLAIGGRTPGGEFPGGYEGVRADQRNGEPADKIAAGRAEGTSSGSSGGDSDEAPTTPPPKKSAAAKADKSPPPKKTTAAAQQRASRSTPRSNQ